MQLISQPANFSSLAHDNHFVFEGADGGSSTEVAFHLADGTLLGVRRYAGRQTIASSPRAFLRRTIDPQPEIFRRSSLVKPEGRDAELYVAYGEEGARSSDVLFTASLAHLQADTAMGPRDTLRTIALGEQDEIALTLARNSRVEVTCTLSDGSVILLDSEIVARRGVWLVGVVPDTILSYSSQPLSVEWFDVTVVVGGELLTRVHYTLTERPEGAVRLAWLNPRGYLTYHTFEGLSSSQLATRRSEAFSQGVTTTLALEGWRELSLSSGVLSRSEAQRVGEVATSPRVWRMFPDGTAEPCTLLSSSVGALGREALSVELTLRPSKTTTYW